MTEEQGAVWNWEKRYQNDHGMAYGIVMRRVSINEIYLASSSISLISNQGASGSHRSSSTALGRYTSSNNLFSQWRGLRARTWFTHTQEHSASATCLYHSVPH
ncbi:hypothetical protein WAI453_002694 [Rhynchosporium graminicola]